jgi:ABC-2 type transport system ATP-binding protein
MESVPLLRIDALTKRYGAVTALDSLSVEVPDGRVGVVGANGAGKTTLFRILLGLARPTNGSVQVSGVNVAHDPIAVRSRLGYMPEHECLPLDQTAADVVATFGELSGLPMRAARQRASDLLDEPTAGLDPAGREEMLALVARLGTFGISVLMSTHLLDDVQRVCDYVVMIDGGRLVVAGPTDSLLERTGTVTVDVGDETAVGQLAAALVANGMHAEVADGVVQVTVANDADLDRIRDTVVELRLPLFRLGSRLTSLDEVFFERAVH